MRIVNLNVLLLGSALAAGTASQLGACGPYCEPEPAAIKFPGIARASVLRGDYLLCANDADGHALLLDRGRLLAVALNDGKTVHEVSIGDDPVWAFGFAGTGRAFVHRGRSVAILELATRKTLHTIELGDGDTRRSPAWQKVGSRLFVPGPATTLCVIDLDSGKLCERFALDSRAGIAALHVEGSQVYCIGSASAWAARIDH